MRSKWWRNRIKHFLVAAAAVWAMPLFAQQMAWTRWETQLTASLPYTNAYKNVLLQVTWTCLTPSDCNAAAWEGRLTTYGFWDGGQIFRIRAAFPQPYGTSATWQWQTSCSSTNEASSCVNDGGLHNRSGTVTVSRSDSSPNPLYRGGLFGMSEHIYPDGRANIHFYNALGPFYWQGDTAWNASIRASFNQLATPDCNTAAGWDTNGWKCYVANRVAKNFTAVQVAMPQSYMANPLKDTDGHEPFIGSANWNQWKPEFWQGFEKKVQWANEQGLVVLLVGLIEPAYSSSSPRYPPEADAVIFARNLAARLGGNFVIYSPGFDTKPDTAANRSRIRAVGNAIHGVSPRPVITNHFGGQTNVGVSDGLFDDYADFNNEPWLDTNMFQSGQARTLRNDPGAPNPQLQLFTQRARTMPRDLRNLSPRKGSANIESIYDYEGLILTGSAPVWAPNYTAFRVRHTGYLSTLSGAFGYSMGVAGVYDWGLGTGPEYFPRAPRDSVNSASSTHVQRLGNLFRAHRWHLLMPVDLVLNNPPVSGNQHLQMVVSRDLSRRSTLAYLPDNGTIQLSLSTTLYPDFANPARWQKQWFNPRTGARQTATPSGSAPNFTFTRPATGDWVLELIDLTQGALLVSSGPSLQAWASHDDEAQTWSITGQLVDKNGAAAGDAFAISDASSGVQRLPLITRAAGGAFVVVWEAENGIFARRVGANGALLGAVQRVSEAGSGRQFDPVLTADASGAVVVAWTDVESATNASRIVARRFSRDLTPLGAEIVVSAGAAANRRSPLVAADAAGNFVVAWETYEPASRTSSIAARRFDANGTASSEQLIEWSDRRSLALERLELDAAGSVRVLWQELGDHDSHGHYSRTFDRKNKPVGRRALVASESE